MKKIALFFLALSSYAGTVTVSVTGVTPQQIVLDVRTSTAATCTVQVSTKPDFSDSVDDVNESLFTGSSRCDRQGSIVTGTNYKMVIGLRRAALASDGLMHSRSLAWNTTYYIKATNGTDTATAVTTTLDPPLGNSAPDPIPFDKNGSGNAAFPTIDYNNLYGEIVDPQTGAPLYQAWHPGDEGWRNPGDWNNPLWSMNEAIDLGSAWTVNNGLIGTCTGAACASDGIVAFSIRDTGWNMSNWRIDDAQDGDDVVDAQVHLNGFASGSGDDAKINVCLSDDLGKTCETDTMTFTLPTGTAGDVWSDNGPGQHTFPAPYFRNWGGAKVKWRTDQMSIGGWISSFTNGNTFVGAGSGISPDGAPADEFPVSLFTDIPNYPIYISGTAPDCPNNLCHVAKVINSTTIQTVETISNYNPNATLASDFAAGAASFTLTDGSVVIPNGNGQQDVTINGTHLDCGIKGTFGTATVPCNNSTGTTFPAGATVNINHWALPSTVLKIWKYNGNGSITINSGEMRFQNGRPPSTGNEGNGGNISCSADYLTISVADDGVTPITPQKAEECTYAQWGMTGGGNGNLYAVFPETGESRKIVSMRNNNTREGSRSSDGIHFRNTQNGQNCVHTYDASWVGLSWSTNPDDPAHMTDDACTSNDNFGNPQINPVTLLHQVHPEVDTGYLGEWKNINAGGTVSGQRYLYSTDMGQNHEFWWCMLDLSKPSGPEQVMECDNSWQHYPIRWSGSHAGGEKEYFGISSDYVSAGPSHLRMDYSGSEYDFPVNTVYNNGGTTAMTAAFVDTSQTCEAMGVTDQRWIAEGATGNHCVKINIGREPLWTNTVSAGALTWTGTVASGGQTSMLSASASGKILTISGGSATADYNNQSYTYAASYSVTLSGAGSGWVFAYLDTDGTVSFDTDIAGTCSGCGKYTVQNSPYFPDRTIPLWDWHVTNGSFDASGHDFRRFPLGSTMISGRPYPWAHNSAACGGDDSTTTCGAYLTTIQPGDVLTDIAETNEQMLIAAKTVLSDGTIDLVIARNPHSSITGAGTTLYDHAAGWTGFMELSGIGGGVSYQIPSTTDAAYDPATNKPNYIEQAGTGGAHQEVYTRNNDYIVVAANGWSYPASIAGNYSGFGIVYKALPEGLQTPFMYGSNEIHGFDGVLNGIQIPSNTLQSHPGGLTWNATDREAKWAADGFPPGPAGGGKLDLGTQTVTLVAGKTQTYKLSAFTAGDYYQGGNIATSTMTPKVLKTRATYAWVGRYMLKNMSSSGSASSWGASSDSQSWTYCVAAFAGECVAGSAAGDEYISAPNVDATTGSCGMSPTEMRPCLLTGSPVTQKAAQFGIDRDDPFGLRYRQITSGLTRPGSSLNYWNAQSDPEGNFLWVESDHPNNGQISTLLMAKLPPWPNEDSENRTTFVPVKVAMPGVAGSTVRIRFGYAEYGLDSNNQPLFCSDRQEDCSTAVSNSDPYAWVGEPQTWTDCASDCTVNVPAISGRVLYYVEDRNIGGTVHSSPLKAMAVQ